MNEGLQKLQVPEFKDKLFSHYYYWEFYSLELFTWTHNIAFETFALNLGCLFELRCMMSSTAAASNRPVVLLTLLNKPRLDKKERSFTTFSDGLNEALSIQWFWCSWMYWWNLRRILSVEENLFVKSHCLLRWWRGGALWKTFWRKRQVDFGSSNGTSICQILWPRRWQSTFPLIYFPFKTLHQELKLNSYKTA